jgi:hypothetical protein
MLLLLLLLLLLLKPYLDVLDQGFGVVALLQHLDGLTKAADARED